MKDTIKKISAAMAAAALLGAGSIMLTGCDSIAGVVTGNPVMKKILEQKTTDYSDRQAYVEVQDINGVRHPSVLYFEPVSTSDFDISAFQTQLQTSNANWYQLIATDNKGSREKEHAYLYFPVSASYSDIVSVLNTMNAQGKFTGRWVEKDEMENYANSNNNSVYQLDLYKTEMTYYGPASQKQSS